MKKILVIQSRRRPEMLSAEQGEYTRALPPGAEAHFISSLDTAQAWDEPASMLTGFAGVMLGGSGEFDFDGGRALDDPARVTSLEIVQRMRPLVVYILEQGMPILGVCYGHQIVSEVLGVSVCNDTTQNKIGTFAVSLTPEGAADPLFSQLPPTFKAQYGHKDSLASVPTTAVVLASGARCRTSALRYGSAAYTVQFHPELTAEDLKWKFANSPGYLPQGVSVESIVKPSPEASLIIPLFIETIVR